MFKDMMKMPFDSQPTSGAPLGGGALSASLGLVPWTRAARRRFENRRWLDMGGQARLIRSIGDGIRARRFRAKSRRDRLAAIRAA